MFRFTLKCVNISHQNVRYFSPTINRFKSWSVSSDSVTYSLSLTMANWTNSYRLYIPVYEGKVAIASFLMSVITLLIVASTISFQSWWTCSITAVVEALYLLVLGLYIVTPVTQIVLYSHSIGLVFAVGVLMSLSRETYVYFGFYAMALAFFHISEYTVTSIFNADKLSTDSFLVNHSTEYCVAAAASFVEYWIEYLLFPNMKSLHLISIVGAVIVICGELLRKVAMFTAGSNFTHIVQTRKRDHHKLVTSGVYALFRHPSYVGWFYWSLGTQVLLCNPVCLVGYVAASWMFFSERIYHEEIGLINFFGEDYVKYKQSVGTGIPFVSGYPIDLELMQRLAHRRQH